MRSLANICLVCVLAGALCQSQEISAPSGGGLEQASKLIEAKQFAKAGDLLRDIVHKDPGNEAANLKLGQVLLAQGLNEDALTSFETVLALDQHSEAAREGEVQGAEAAALVDRKAGIDGSALLCLIRARKFVPNSPRLLLDFGIQAESMKIFGDAEAALAKAHELDTGDPKIIYALARVQMDEQKMPDAEANLRTYLKMRPDDATGHYGLGRLLHMLVRDDEAKAELERSLVLQPRQTGSLYELGEIARETDKPEEAKRYYNNVLSRAPHHGGALTGLGIIAYRAKDYSAAEQYLQHAIMYAADYASAHHYYSLVLSRLGRDTDAKQEADLAESLNKKQAKERGGNQLTVVQ